MLSNVLFFLILFFACIVSGLVGFGSNILALPFLSLFLDVKTIVPVLVLTVLCNGIPRLLTQYRSVNLLVYLYMLPLAALGGACGVHLVHVLHEGWMKLLLSLLMLIIAFRGLHSLHKSDRIPAKAPKNNPLYAVIPFLGGIMQGAFGLRRPYFQYLYFTEAAEKRRDPRHPVCHRRHISQLYRAAIPDERRISGPDTAFCFSADPSRSAGLCGQRTHF